MAQPTQVYPPWLTPVPETIYDQDGVPITTSTTILYLPLTYYGPSIPLGAEWTYGGITPPASTVTISATTVIPSSSLSTPTATATPSTSSSSSVPSSTSSSSSIPSSTSSSSSIPSSTSSSSVPSSTSTSSPSTSNTATPQTVTHQLTRNQLIGIIVGAVIGALVILLALFVCFLLVKNRRRGRRTKPKMSIDEDFIIVEPEVHASGDGSPRQSGEERDSLLQVHSGQPTIIQRGVPAYQPLAGPSYRTAPRGPGELGVRPAAPDTLSSTNSGNSGSSTEMSSLGSIVPNSRFSALSPLAEEQRNGQRATTSRRGQILSLEEQRRVEHEMRSLSSVKEEVRPDSELLPLPPPPRSVDTQHSASRLLQKGSDSSGPQVRTAFVPLLHRSVKQDETLGSSNRSSTFYDPEEAALVTAQRVKGVRPQYYPPPEGQSTSGGILSSISSRLSWFKNLDSLPSRRRSETPKSIKLSDKDGEADQALLGPISDSSDSQSPIWSYPNNPSQPRLSAVEPQQSTTHLRPYARLGFVSDAIRPESGISGRSAASSGAGTTYFDAYSTFPNTPVLTPLPRAMTPAPSSLSGQSSKESSLNAPSPLAVGRTAGSQTQGPPVEFGGRGRETPPTYDENDTIVRVHSRELASREGGVDVLDLPAPSALSGFRHPSPAPITVTASTSTAFSNTNTVSSATAPTLFTQTEGSLSTSTSQSSIKDSSNETARAGGSKPDRSDGSGGTATGTVAIVNMVHVPQTGQAVFATKNKLYAASNSSAIHGSKILSNREDPTYLHSSSKGTKRPILTGTTFAGESQRSIPINSVDMLEDEPPLPGEGWRSLANVIGGSAAAALLSAERRFTLGMLPQRLPHDAMLAELGSLHAMRSHLSPVSSNRSTGSAPASKREMSGSTGSLYSQPSAQHSFTHSGSISSSEGRLRYPSSFRYGVREGSSSSNSRSGGAISPALSAFGNQLRKQPSDEIPVPRNLTPLSEQHAYESGSSYYTAPSTLGSRKTAVTQNSSNTFRSATTIQSADAAPALMEIEEDVVDAARRAAAATRGDIEFGLLSPRSQASELSASVSLSSAPWAAGLDQNWMPL